MGQSETARTSRAWQATCLVVGPPNADDSLDPLIESLRKRGLIVQQCDNAHAAMTDALMRRGTRGEGRASEPLVFVMVEPDRCPRSGELHEAASRHIPHAVFWEYQRRPAERLTTYQPRFSPEVQPPGPVPVPMVARGVAARRPPVEVRPSLRLTGEGEASDGPGARIKPREDRTGLEPSALDTGHARLTEEELEMLLGAGPEEETTGGGAIDR